MRTYLTSEQRDAIEEAQGAPVIAIDRVLQEKYVIVPMRDYDRLVEALVENGIPLTDVFRTQVKD